VFPGVTQFERIHNGKKEPAHFKDLANGDRVVILPVDDRPNIARMVAIISHKKEKKHAIRGVVTAINRDVDRDNGSFTVRVKDKDNAGGKKPDHDLRKFQVIPQTKFVRIHEGQRAQAYFKDLKEGQHVQVYRIDDRPDFARLVEILDRERPQGPGQQKKGNVSSK
jgi:hypothetical protein